MQVTGALAPLDHPLRLTVYERPDEKLSSGGKRQTGNSAMVSFAVRLLRQSTFATESQEPHLLVGPSVELYHALHPPRRPGQRIREPGRAARANREQATKTQRHQEPQRHGSLVSWVAFSASRRILKSREGAPVVDRRRSSLTTS